MYREEGADAVLSDDRVFLRYLGKSSVPYLTPGAGLSVLERLRKHIRDPVYREAVEEETKRRWRRMSGRSYPLRIPENLIELAEARARDERTDRATALRQLMYAGAEEYVVRLLEQGRISVSKAAELLDSSVHRIHLLAREHGIDLGPTPEEHEQATRTARHLL